MKKQNYLLFLASVMLVTFASCKSSNKLYAIAGEGTQMFGPECYHLHDYGFFFNNLKQNVADRMKAFLEK